MYLPEEKHNAPGDFERDTLVTGSYGTYRAVLSPKWDVWGPNGGYLAAIAMRAAGEEARLKRPVSFYCHFLRVARFDGVTVIVQPVQSGRRSESLRVSMVQDGKPVLEGLLRTAQPGDGLEHMAFQTPGISDPESLPLLDDLVKSGTSQHPFWKNIEVRVHQTERISRDRLPAPPHWLEWYRYRPRAVFANPFLDAARALVLIDTVGWPAVWLQHPNPDFHAPNLDVMAFFHAPMEHSEWLLCEQESPIGAAGLIGTRARVFDRQGQLVASGGAQLMCVPVPASRSK